jgi:hypothetical protein
MPENITAQGEWLNTIKTTGCIAGHGIGTPGTRTISAVLGHFDTSAGARARRIQSGQAETNMVNTISRLDPPLAFQYFGDWTDRIANGELPFAKPLRPQGDERNIVLTLWDWSRPTAYMHDLHSDKIGAIRPSMPMASSMARPRKVLTISRSSIRRTIQPVRSSIP